MDPDGTRVSPEGEFDADGNEVEFEQDLDEKWGVDKKVCYAEDGETVLGDGNFKGDDRGEKRGHRDDRDDDRDDDRHEDREDRDHREKEWEEHMDHFDLGEEVEHMDQTLATVREVFVELADVDDQKMARAVAGLNKLADQAEVLLDRIKEVIVDGEVTDEEVVEEAWDMMEELGDEAEKYMETLTKYFEKNPEKLKELSAESQEHVEMWMAEQRGELDRGERRGPKFDDVYEGRDFDGDFEERLMRDFDEEEFEEMLREIRGELMEELGDYLDEEVLHDILKNLKYLGDDVLERNLEVYAEVDDFEGLDEDFERLGRMTRSLVIDESLAEELREKWDEVDAAFENEDEEALERLYDEIEELLEQNRELIYRSEDAVLFEDLDLDHWSTEYVFELREEGAIDGYRDRDGKKLGLYGPGDQVTLAELVKMAMVASGQDIRGGSGQGHWAETGGFMGAARNLWLDQLIDFADLNRAATREEAAVVISVAFGLPTDLEWEEPFADYDGPFKGAVQAVYDAGIFTGQGDDGSFAGDDPLNRAEVAKIIRVAGKDLKFSKDVEKFLEKLEEL